MTALQQVALQQVATAQLMPLQAMRMLTNCSATLRRWMPNCTAIATCWRIGTTGSHPLTCKQQPRVSTCPPRATLASLLVPQPLWRLLLLLQLELQVELLQAAHPRTRRVRQQPSRPPLNSLASIASMPMVRATALRILAKPFTHHYLGCRTPLHETQCRRL